MAHYAEIDDNNIVLRVVVIRNEDQQDANGVDDEVMGVAYCKSIFGEDTKWLRTSYHGSVRKNYACAGYAYNPSLDAFVPPKPYPSWVLNETTATWDAPAVIPNDAGNYYTWDEATLSWLAHPVETVEDAAL